ncbi:MAG TPA: hypothetical protein VF868_15180 [Bacteroidia bacterium]|jgi:hypothetical protein
MKEEFIELYVKNKFYDQPITDENLPAFARCCFLMYSTTIDTTCAQCMAGFKDRLKTFWDNQLAKGYVPPVYAPEMLITFFEEPAVEPTGKGKKKK